MNLTDTFAPFSPPLVDFVEQIRYWALAVPDQTAMRFLPRGEEDPINRMNAAFRCPSSYILT